ncbi:hypothetical protein MKW92_012992 [Papaver armeniacum]|nr:hypothetical protein MKW92_012992 [Papaver armeniacum]
MQSISSLRKDWRLNLGVAIIANFKWGSSMSLSQFTAEGDVEFEAVLFVHPKASRWSGGYSRRELLKLFVQFMGLAS